MTFLQLCQRLRQEVGIAGTGPTTVTGQTGELKRIVDWVASAWEEIQNSRTDWDWMRSTFSFTTVADQDSYTSTQAGISSRFDRWDTGLLRIYTTASGVGDETLLDYIPYDDWRMIYRVGNNTAGRPTTATILPGNSLGLGYKPSAGFTVRGEYWKSAQTLSSDSDTPEMPSAFHMAIVYKAMMYYARYMAANEIYEDAAISYRRVMNRLLSDRKPSVLVGGPLA